MSTRTRTRRYQLYHPDLDASIEELLKKAQEVYGQNPDVEYIRQVMVTAVRLLRDRVQRGDLKLINSALKELRHALYVFGAFPNVRKIAVFGSARTPPEHPEWQQARRFAERITAEGWMVITGAGDGIMGAAQGGAGRERSFGVNIRLPFEQAANKFIAGDKKLVNFRYFFTRKLVFVKESHAIVLFPGGFGTHDEGFEALTLIQTGKSEILPVVFMDSPGGTYWRDWHRYVSTHLLARGLISPHDIALYKVTDDLEEGVREVLNFYSNYHSSRYVGDRLVLRVRRAPTKEQLEAMNRDFKGIVSAGEIEVSKPLPEENGEVSEYPRVVLQFNRRDMGRLRQMIDRINSFVPEPASPAVEASPHELVPEAISPEAEAEEEED